jgi:hypothetical protein
MSVPTNQLVWAGIWNVSSRYPQYQFVQSPLDSLCYVNPNSKPNVGGPDPSVQPSVFWVLLNPQPTTLVAYGAFSSTVTQTLNPSFPTLEALTVQYDTADVSAVGLSTDPFPISKIEVVYGGVYKVLASIQLDKSTGGTGEIDMYPVVNGIPVPNSATKLVINQNLEDIMTIEWFLTLNATDIITIECYSPSNGISLLAVPASAPVPAIPSIILTILRIA